MAEIKNPVSGTIVVKSYQSEVYPFQDGALLNTKIYKTWQTKTIDYDVISISTGSTWLIWSSLNWFKFDQYDVDKTVVIKPNQKLRQWTFRFFIDAWWAMPQISISQDWKNYTNIVWWVENYDTDYIKLSYGQSWSLSNVIINSIEFTTWDAVNILVNSVSTSPIMFYAWYNCRDESLDKLITNLIPTRRYVTSVDTKNYVIDFWPNLIYNTTYNSDFYQRDYDRDRVLDDADNCNGNYNPDQLDSNSNGLWDVCDDDDWDYVLNPVDNCPEIANRNQFDGDEDGLWDACDSKDDRYLESNKALFVWIAVGIIILFGWLIYLMLKKIPQSQKITR